jgi:type III secretory pathway component EscR
MGQLFDLIKEKIMNKQNGERTMNQLDDGIDDYETRDKQVKSLRRELRKYQDQDEKKLLRDIIKKKQAEHERKILFNQDNILKVPNVYKAKRRKKK